MIVRGDQMISFYHIVFRWPQMDAKLAFLGVDNWFICNKLLFEWILDIYRHAKEKHEVYKILE